MRYNLYVSAPVTNLLKNLNELNSSDKVINQGNDQVDDKNVSTAPRFHGTGYRVQISGDYG